MSDLHSIGAGPVHLPKSFETPTELVLIHRPLDRIMQFVGYNIHDVVNNPVAKHAVLGYFKLFRHVQRGCEIVDLERQWNPI